MKAKTSAPNEFADTLRDILQERRISIREAARGAGVYSTTLSRAIRAETEPVYGVVLAVARGLGVPACRLFPEDVRCQAGDGATSRVRSLCEMASQLDDEDVSRLEDYARALLHMRRSRSFSCRLAA